MGFDPIANAAADRTAEAAAVAKAAEIPPLDPPFPFVPKEFDPWFFNLQLDLPKPPEPLPGRS